MTNNLPEHFICFKQGEIPCIYKKAADTWTKYVAYDSKGCSSSVLVSEHKVKQHYEEADAVFTHSNITDPRYLGCFVTVLLSQHCLALIRSYMIVTDYFDNNFWVSGSWDTSYWTNLRAVSYNRIDEVIADADMVFQYHKGELKGLYSRIRD